jgi:hypothetical protein|tara:strand:- start:2457 stop:3017 length:561 start_codon:yes stop_codon:yes gene_type:complete
MDKLPVIYLTINDDEETGLDAISLVDSPAIEREFLAFNKQHKFSLNEEKRIVSGAAMVADYPIYRKDEEGREYYVVFDAESIRKIAYRFMKEGKTNATNLDHETPVDGVFMFESFLIDETKPTPKGFDKLTNGSWFVSYKVDNDEVWKQVKDGTFKGFSVEGVFSESRKMDVDKMIIEEIEKALSS